MSAAFDTIDHDSLLNCLEHVFGVHGSALSFVKSYLEEWTQVVSVLGFDSEPSTVSYGVPQGSVLGPILFILYTQALSDIIACHSVLHHVFADDTELYKSVSRDKIPVLLNAMQRCVADVKLWTINNKLQLNEDKTKSLLTSPFRFCRSSVRFEDWT